MKFRITIALLAAAALTAVVVPWLPSGDGGGGDPASLAPVQPEAEPRQAEVWPERAPSEPARARVALSDTDLLRRRFGRLEKSLGGTVGIVVGPARSNRRLRLGSFRSGAAWSTVKVPIAIAWLRQDPTRLESADWDLAVRAITQSDNEAAASLWEDLGTANEAASATQQVLAGAGDQSTEVQSSRTRAQFSPYGQTRWSLVNQQRFAAQLSCILGAEPVLELMGDIASSQRWGVGTISTTARFKGGWGPGTDDRYLVRQFGLARGGGQELALSMAFISSDGTFESGKAALNRVARWVKSNAKLIARPAKLTC